MKCKSTYRAILFKMKCKSTYRA